MSQAQATLVDQHQIKFNMAATAILLALAFIVNSWVIVAVTVICQLMGAAGLPFAPYRLIYTMLVVPSGLVKPNAVLDHHAPHRFAALVGGVFNLIGIAFLLADQDVLGWIFVGIVFVLSNLNLWLGFCAGCFCYYIMNRIGVPGFVHSPVGSD